MLYINDLPDVIPEFIEIKMFADDVKIYNIGALDPVKTQICLTKIEEWSNMWQLPISEKKSAVLHVGRNNGRHHYNLFGANIESKKEVRDLGILIDEKLRFDRHITNIACSAYLRCNHILKCFRTRNLNTYISAYKTYVRPLLEYSTEVFNPSTRKLVKQMEKPQRFFTRNALKKCGMGNMLY